MDADQLARFIQWCAQFREFPYSQVSYWVNAFREFEADARVATAKPVLDPEEWVWK